MRGFARVHAAFYKIFSTHSATHQLHTTEANINLFINSFNKLKKNGIYIIEDVNHNHFNDILEKLKDFNPELVILEKNNLYSKGANNLIVIRNN